MSCTVCRKAEGRAKVEVSTASATTVESSGHSAKFCYAKVVMTVKVGQSEKDGQKVKVGTCQIKVGSNKGQEE